MPEREFELTDSIIYNELTGSTIKELIQFSEKVPGLFFTNPKRTEIFLDQLVKYNLG